MRIIYNTCPGLTVCLLFYNTSEVMQLAKCNVEWYYDACKEHRIVYDPTKDSQVSTLYIVHCTLYIVHVHCTYSVFSVLQMPYVSDPVVNRTLHTPALYNAS